MRTVDLTAYAHRLVTLSAKQLVFGLLVVRIFAVAEIQDRLLGQRFAFVLAGNLVLVVLEVTVFAEVGLLGQAKVSGHHVLATLAQHFLRKG
jgi:hypothetical protein